MVADKIQDRIQGRKAAEEVWQLAEDLGLVTEGDSPILLESFFAELKKLAGIREDTVIEKEVVPIKRLAATQVPFGKYYNLPFDKVPLEYLDWLCKSQEDFNKQLSAYLKHPDLASHRGEFDNDY